MPKTDILPDVEKEITEPDGMAHVVRIRALLAGGAVVALCGKKFVPKEIAKAVDREPCATCAHLFELIKMMYG